MKKEYRKNLWIAAGLLFAFVAWTIAICRIDVQPIGPMGSSVGFAALNGFFHKLTGVHMWLYTVTDWLGLVPLCLGMGFAVYGLVQMIRRKSIVQVDSDILTLGGFYLLVLGAYVLFEYTVVNYRPVLIEGSLEASYPSSTTLLTLCMTLTAMTRFERRIKNRRLQRGLACGMLAFAVFMVVGRLISGVHWLTDIVGGALLSAGLIMLDYAANDWIVSKAKRNTR